MKAAVKNTQVSRRDSATAILRKLGIAKPDYNKFVSLGEDGLFFVNVEDAVRSLQKPVKKAKAAKVAKEPKITLASSIRHLVAQGKTNAEIFEELKLPADKRWYPAWYRAAEVRKAAKAQH